MRILLVVLVCGVAHGNASAQFDHPGKVVAAGEHALVANRGSGEITVVGRSGQIAVSTDVGSNVTAIYAASAGTETDFLITEEAALLHMRLGENDLAIVDRLALRQPGQIAVDHESNVAVVTSKWNASAHVVRLQPRLVLAKSVNFSFSPGHVVPIGNARFLIADAFGGKMAVLDAAAGKIIGHSKLRGHNICGLLRNGDEVLIAHQILSQTARTELADVHWGALMQNVISRVSIKSLLSGKPKTSTIALGDVEAGAADPAEMVRLSDGRIAIALSGVDEVLISSLPDKRGRFRFAKGERIKVGKRPTSMAVLRNGTVVVTNELGDSVSIIDVQERTAREVPASRARKLTAIERGEQAFFSARLSHDNWLSCHSCHTSGHSPGLLADTLGDSAFGNPKLIPSLLGVGRTAPFGWSGNFDRLPAQIEKSIRTTMHGTPDEQTTADIATYLQALKPLKRSSINEPPPPISQGGRVFDKHGCSRCHAPSNGFTSPDTYDVGFQDETGQSKFNPPSLRGIRHRTRFFHDGRAKTLRQALDLHTRALEKRISGADLKAVERFLRGL